MARSSCSWARRPRTPASPRSCFSTAASAARRCISVCFPLARSFQYIARQRTNVPSDFIQYFSARGHPTYALSLRGHGHSYRPSFFRLTYLTSAPALAGDIAAATTHIHLLHNRAPVLLGHSNGGGLAQIALDQGLTRVAGLILLAAAPNFGGTRVNQNWVGQDPWFIPRLLWHGGHPRSALSSPALTHRVFFSPEFPRERVEAFGPLMCSTEAWRWPLFTVRRNYVDAKKVLLGCGGNVLVVGGERDVLFDVAQTRQMGTEYGVARRELVGEKKLEDDGSEEVPVRIIAKSGHHVQNDLYWEDAAREIERWLGTLQTS